MFESLSDKLQRIFRDLRGQGALTEKVVDGAMREMRIALLEADVHYKVVKEFLGKVRERAVGTDVLESLTPGQQVVKVVRDELTALLGEEAKGVALASKPPTVVMLVGLQGSGKTTTTGKLATWFKKRGHRPYLVPADLQRPAAVKQLQTIGRAIDVPVAEVEGDDPVEVARGAVSQAARVGYDVIVVDTAGRLHVDEELMKQLERIRGAVDPHEVLYVADAMTGQDALRSASEFHGSIGLTGVVLSKLDGDARGGAALSIRHVTGLPIRFLGTGEKYDALETFHPERMASRIVGMGDVLSLIEKAEETFSKEESAKLSRDLARDGFTLETFRDQLRKIRKMGPLSQVLQMVPGMGQALKGVDVDDKELVRIEAIIDSMTPSERRNPQIINGSRRKRIARGSGNKVEAVNRLLKQFSQMRKMMRSLTGKGGSKARRRMKMPFMG